MLLRAWIWLVGLSLAATALALGQPMLPPLAAKGAGLAILVISWIKANLLLRDYLELRRAPRIRGGFRFALSLFLIAAGALYLFG